MRQSEGEEAYSRKGCDVGEDEKEAGECMEGTAPTSLLTKRPGRRVPQITPACSNSLVKKTSGGTFRDLSYVRFH